MTVFTSIKKAIQHRPCWMSMNLRSTEVSHASLASISTGGIPTFTITSKAGGGKFLAMIKTDSQSMTRWQSSCIMRRSSSGPILICLKLLCGRRILTARPCMGIHVKHRKSSLIGLPRTPNLQETIFLILMTPRRIIHRS